MGWKNWDYWLKGGVIGLTINVVLQILALIYDFVLYPSIYSGFTLALVNVLFAFPFLFPTQIIINIFHITTLKGYPGLILISIEALVGAFLIGALIGWIVGKIRNRNQ